MRKEEFKDTACKSMNMKKRRTKIQGTKIHTPDYSTTRGANIPMGRGCTDAFTAWVYTDVFRVRSDSNVEAREGDG